MRSALDFYAEMRQNMPMCHVAYACNNEYAIPVGVSLYSLFENNTDIALCVHLYGENLSQENKDALASIAEQFHQELVIEDMPDIEKIIGVALYLERESEVLSISTYLRIFLSKMLSSGIDKVLYLDSDTLVAGNLKELFDEDLKGMGGAAVLGVGAFNKRCHGFKTGESYYNAGVFLFNLAYWREKGICDLIISEMKRRGGKSLDHDQDYINCILRGKIKTVNPKYNFMVHYFAACNDFAAFLRNTGLEEKETYPLSVIKEAQSDVRIYHLNSMFIKSLTVRPWYSNDCHPFSAKWRECLEKTPYRGTSFAPFKGKMHKTESEVNLPLYKVIKRKTIAFFVRRVPLARLVYVRIKFGFWHK